MFLLFFFFLSHNNSYADSNISYSYRKGSTTSTKSYSYGTAFTEKTTKGEGIACSGYANCYVGCSCQSGWTQGSVPSSGEYVWATDNRYTGVNALSVSNVGDINSLTDGKSAQSTSGNTQVVSLSGGVSTMGSSGGMTCYKAACPSGYYLDKPNTTAFKYTSTSGTIGLTCYKATECNTGYNSSGKGTSYSWHGMNCNKVTTFYLCRTKYTETPNTKESRFSATCPSNTVVVARYHSGDENGGSQLRCGTFAAFDTENGDVGTCKGNQVSGISITVEDTYWSSWQKESGSNYDAPSGYVIVGREHSGDENGNTRYKVGKIYVSDGKTKKAATMYDWTSEGPWKESKGENGNGWSAKNGAYMLIGRVHNGDENGSTYHHYQRAKADLYN